MGKSRGLSRQPSPARPFGEVHLLSNYAPVVHKPFATWLGGKPVIHAVDLPDPTEYTQLFEVSNRVLAQVIRQPPQPR